jgi:hypothetical protein
MELSKEDEELLSKIGIAPTPVIPHFGSGARPIGQKKRVAHGYTILWNKYRTKISVILLHGKLRLGIWEALSDKEANDIFSRVLTAVAQTIYEDRRALGTGIKIPKKKREDV